jgi:hypothetical protein
MHLCCLPATHDVRVPTEELCQARHHYVRKWQSLYVEKVADGIVYDHQEVVLVGEGAQACEIW